MAAAQTTDASTAATGGSGGAACNRRVWPPPPTDSSGGPDDVDIVVAARLINFGETDLSMGPLVGLDLDNHCTCQGDGPSCQAPPADESEHCDGPEGIDNAVAEFFKFLGTFDMDFTSGRYTTRAEEGNNSMLVRIRDYNGGANDDQVTLSLHPSPGRDTDPCGGPKQPSWDGTDTWPISSVSIRALGGGGMGGGMGGAPACGNNGFDPDDPLYADSNAYVTNYVVVANVPDLALQFVSDDDSVAVRLTAGFVVGTLRQEANGWALRDGVIVGRWRLSDLFAMVGQITSQGQPICTDHPVYPLIKKSVCKFPDIASTLAGPTAICDALSFGLGFDAEAARFGAVIPQQPAPSLCPPATEPALDNCDDVM